MRAIISKQFNIICLQVEEYNGKRDLADLKAFVEKHLAGKVEKDELWDHLFNVQNERQTTV